MDSKTLFKQALHLKPAEKIKLMEWLAQSLDKSDSQINQIWAEESEKRYDALISGKVKTIPLDEIINRYK